MTAFRERFLAESPATSSDAITIHTFLSLARLAQISTTIHERTAFTPPILAAAEHSSKGRCGGNDFPHAPSRLSRRSV
jgi:hypothetical protein